MSAYITIDGGTTSTRVNLMKNTEIIDSVKLCIGARDSMENREKYTCELKNAIDKIIMRISISGI